MNKFKISLKYSAMLLVAALGRFPVSWMLSKKNGKKLKWPKPSEHHWVKCASGNEFYVEFDGPVNAQPLVFIHGLNATREQWYYQRQYFNKSYRLVFIDLPGHGGSTVAANLSVPVLAKDLKRVLGFLHIHNPIIYGHSWGSSILMHYCLQPESGINAKGVILHGGSYTNPLKAIPLNGLGTALEKPVIVPLLKLINSVAPVFDVLTRLFYTSGISVFAARFAFFAGQQTAAQLRYTSQMAPHCKTQAVTGGLLQLFKIDLTGQLQNLKIPALVIGSLHDRVHQFACSRYIHQQVPGSQFVTLQGGHQSMIENYEEVNNAVNKFIQQL